MNRFQARSGFQKAAGGHEGYFKSGMMLQMDETAGEDPAT